MNHVVALSGGKDSTAMALRLAEIEPRDYLYICTPTGNESPEMQQHWVSLEKLLGKCLVRLTNRTLSWWIEEFQALPNWRQRWCTRLLKIEPTHAFLKDNQPAILYVGFRADEEAREGIYGETVQQDWPLRRWHWGIGEVLNYLASRGVSVPSRTDCLFCYGQRLTEWKALLETNPELYKQAEDLEARFGHTFRSPGRDTWPASLSDLRAEFERGRPAPQRAKHSACAVCLR